MRTFLMTLVIIAAVTVSAGAVDILSPGYTVQTYATYVDSADYPHHMTFDFDSSGNLYVAQPASGTIWRITPGGVASQFASGLIGPYSITWGGGSSFGNYLYVGGGSITKLALDGTYSLFANHNCVSSLAIDKKGNYGGYLYAGTGGADDFHKINTAGNIMSFGSWPGLTDGGEPDGIAFDPGTAYGGLMFVGSAYTQNNASKSGIFTMDTSGNPTRFSNNLVQAFDLAFDTTGTFGGKLFAMGTTTYGTSCSLYSVGIDGTATRFAYSSTLNGLGLAFGPDGAMYVSEYSSANGMVTISRIVPEPCTLLLLGLGAAVVRRRR
jgi:hypothetical protein